jgi:Protein of unknown function (DUF3443)
VRKILLLALIPLFFLAACGGGGSGSLSGGSGGGSGGSGGSIAGAGPNVVTMVVGPGPTGTQGTFNTPFITITVCAPGSTTNCQTIDHIEVDTGSYGLRIISSVMNSTLLAALPTETTPGFSTPIVECTMFGDGYSWGSMRTADLQISSETAAGVPMQVIGDPAFTNIPSACSSTGPEENTVAQFGANGILGVGPFAQDCGDACAGSTAPGFYYSCPTNGGACSPTQVPTNLQATNPVVLFAADNNGVILELPSIADAGALTTTGAMVFGIGTQGNNSLGSATVLTTDTSYGFISTTYKNTSYPDSFIDSGSNLYYFNDSTLTTCSISSQSFFCPSSEQTLSATNVSASSVQSNVTFMVGNANSVFNANPTFVSFDNVGAPNADPKGIDFGLPFFFGRFVYTAIEGKNTAGGMGPYFAY